MGSTLCLYALEERLARDQFVGIERLDFDGLGR